MSEAYICDAIRTPIGRYGGALSALRPDDLAGLLIDQLMARNPGIDPLAIEEVIIGCANQAGEDNRNVARMAGLLAGLPVSVPGITINRLCASGLDAIGLAARSIRAGDFDLAVAGGVESMSRAPFVIPKAYAAFSRESGIYDTTIGWRFVNPKLREHFGIDTMPETAQNVAREFDVSREAMDAFALRSQQRATKAQLSGRFEREIAGVNIPNKSGPPTRFTRDEHPRADTTAEKLAKLEPVLGPGSTITAGNSSGINDGAAALVIASEHAIDRFSLVPRAKVVASVASGVEPRVMGIGPIVATNKLLSKTSLRLSDIDIIELNEAFASQAIAVLRGLGLPEDAAFVNPNGGAIALGHPLGMSGARLVLTATEELVQRGVNRALCTMCVGVGQGVSMLLERV